MIINRSLYGDWRFNGGSDDWEDFIDSYGYSPQLEIEGVKTQFSEEYNIELSDSEITEIEEIQ